MLIIMKVNQVKKMEKFRESGSNYLQLKITVDWITKRKEKG
jgi:hypothetical protein